MHIYGQDAILRTLLIYRVIHIIQHVHQRRFQNPVSCLQFVH